MVITVRLWWKTAGGTGNTMMRFFNGLTAALAAAAIFFAFPDQAFAWGPGVHMVTGNWILQNLTALPEVVANSLAGYPGLFLQGCLSADIFIGKGCVAKKGHSHNWESGFALLSKAGSARSRAYAYGYLAHLGADTVAHNIFVPSLLPIAPGNGRMAHVYLEMQADRLVTWDSKDALGVFRERSSKKTLRLLQKTLRGNPVKFRLQSGVYQGSIAVGGTALWRESLRTVDRLFPDHVRSSSLNAMLRVATRAAVDVLRLGEASAVLGLDPIGEVALAAASAARAGKGFFPSGGAALPEPVLPDVLLTLPAVCAADAKVAS